MLEITDLKNIRNNPSYQYEKTELDTAISILKKNGTVHVETIENKQFIFAIVDTTNIEKGQEKEKTFKFLHKGISFEYYRSDGFTTITGSNKFIFSIDLHKLIKDVFKFYDETRNEEAFVKTFMFVIEHIYDTALHIKSKKFTIMYDDGSVSIWKGGYVHTKGKLYSSFVNTFKTLYHDVVVILDEFMFKEIVTIKGGIPGITNDTTLIPNIIPNPNFEINVKDTSHGIRPSPFIAVNNETGEIINKK